LDRSRPTPKFELIRPRSAKHNLAQFLAGKQKLLYCGFMGQDIIRRDFESRGSDSQPASAFGPGRGEPKVFTHAQASQPLEKAYFGRENPRKSKSKEPSSGARCVARPRLTEEIQIDIGRWREIFALRSMQPFEKKRSATHNGGKRRPFLRSLPPVCS
jgi:hypothetical protein